MIETLQLDLAVQTLDRALTSEARRLGANLVHGHVSGCENPAAVYNRGLRKGIRGLGKPPDFYRKVHISTGSLADYVAVNHLVDLTQAGPDGVEEALLNAFLSRILREGTLPVPAGNLGSPESPFFPTSGVLLRFNPMKRTGDYRADRGGTGMLFDADAIMAAAHHAVERCRIVNPDVAIGLILCFGRDLSHSVNRKLAEKIRKWRKLYSSIVGIDVAGDERAMTLSESTDLDEMAECFEIAAGNGGEEFPRTGHCGETNAIDVATLCATVTRLKLIHVAHPIFPIKASWSGDDRALRLMSDLNVVAELCFGSNMRTGTIASPAEFGRVLKTLDDWGIRYCFDTDNPELLRTTLALDLATLLLAGAITPEQIENAFRTAHECAFFRRLRAA